MTSTSFASLPPTIRGPSTLRRSVSAAVLAAAVVGSATVAQASVVFLDFEGIPATYPSDDDTQILDFYNGGTSSAGTSGTNYGVSFGSNALAICLNSDSVFCSNTSRGGLGGSSGQGALFFLEGAETYLNVDAGFDTGFAFNYVSLNYSGSVDVYDGLDGTGNLLASLALSPNAGSCPGYNAEFCPFSPIGVVFSGVARSIGFGGVANQIVFDDVTFGADVPGPDTTVVPLPGTLGLLGFGLAGLGISRRRKV